jgi:hypothetical protein
MAGGACGASACFGAAVEGRTPALCSQPIAQTKATMPNKPTITPIDLMALKLVNSANPLFVLRVAISFFLRILSNGQPVFEHKGFVIEDLDRLSLEGNKVKYFFANMRSCKS